MVTATVSSKQAQDIMDFVDKTFEAQREDLQNARDQLFNAMCIVYRSTLVNGNKPNEIQAKKIRDKIRSIDYMLEFLNRGEY